MLGILYYLFWLGLCLFFIYKHPVFRCVKSNVTYLPVFLIKLLFSYLLIWYYRDYLDFGDTADLFIYYNDSLLVNNSNYIGLLEKLKIVLNITSNQDSQTILKSIGYWEREFDYGFYNDNKTMIRLNILMNFISDQNYYINTLFFVFIAFIGERLLIKTMISESNCLVQGPPGTGKSQVIINLLGKLIEAKESTVVVSEKRVALDVIHKKMSALGIGGFCFTTTSHFSNTHFVSALKKEWMRIEENSFKSIKVTNQHSLQKQELQNILNLLHQPGLVSGIKVIDLLNQIDLENKSSVQPYSSSLPTLEEWKNIKQLIEYILEHQLSDIVECLKPELIEKSYLLSIESNLTNWKKAIDRISKEENQVRYKDIYQLARKALIFSKFESQLFRKFNRDLLSNPINRKKIEKKRSELIKQNV